MQIGGDGSTEKASAPSCQLLLDGFGAGHLKKKRFVGGKSVMCSVSSDGKTSGVFLYGFGAVELTDFGTFAKDNSNAANERGTDLGSCSSFSAAPTATSGKEVGRVEYTPPTDEGELLITGRYVTLMTHPLRFFG